ncbi:MAG: bacterial regulatory s, gntR family protein [Subtercola sp.]|jgi:GntR family transcriptional repressor for pyruvate dehydrogenase complex|nr:bacterial regulatory s, gntR family protein [Subtercola sp.]
MTFQFAPTASVPVHATRTKISDEIISNLRRKIASGELARGTQLPNEKELARQYGVSQPTMREAIRALEAMGLLDVYHGRGVFVSQDLNTFVSESLHTFVEFEKIGLAEALDVRGVLGRHSARLAARNAGQAEVDTLELAVKECDEAGALPNVLEMARTVVNFQSSISAAAQNPLLFGVETFLIRLILQLQVDAKEKYGIGYWTEQLSMFRADRHAIIRFIEARDADNAEQAMAKYLVDQKELFERDPDMSVIRFSRPEGSKPNLLTP